MATSKSVVVIDTSVLCVWLKVPGRLTCGPDDNRWDFDRADREIQQHISAGSSLILPLTTIIETGNHIAQATGDRYPFAKELGEIMCKAANAESPWAAFVEQADHWTPENLRKLAGEWPPMAAQKFSIGDATIKEVADYYAAMGHKVELLTGDQQLAAHQPPPPKLIPRRRK
jgi:hypothetical protein